MTVAHALAELALNTTSRDITESAYLAAKKLILDTIGCTIAGSNQPGMRPILDQVREWGGKPECTILVHGGWGPAPGVAFLNGSMAHALDLDDVHLSASLHIMASMLPTVFAAAQMAGTTGQQILDATVIGVEIAGRIGLEFNKRRQHGGFLNATVAGGYGTAAAACRLLGLDVEQTVNALGIYHSQNCGNRQALYDHTLTKRIQPGWAARNAIWAAALAKRGLTGPKRIFEGSCNLFLLYGANKPPWPKPEDVAGVRDEWETEWTSLKRFCSCGAMHPAVQAALDLANDNDLQPDDIDRVILFLGKGKNAMVGVPWDMGPNPQVDAQFCAPYCVALALMRRTAAISAMTDDAIRSDVEVQDLAKRVEMVYDWEGVEGKPTERWQNTMPQIVAVHTKSGKYYESWGSRREVFDQFEMSYDDVAAKFHDCVEFSGRFTPQREQQIVDAVAKLEDEPNGWQFVEEKLVAS